MLEANWLDEVLESLNEERVTPCYPVLPRVTPRKKAG